MGRAGFAALSRFPPDGSRRGSRHSVDFRPMGSRRVRGAQSISARSVEPGSRRSGRFPARWVEPGSLRSVDTHEFLEGAVALLDLLRRQDEHPLGAEILDVEGADDAAVDHGATQGVVRDRASSRARVPMRPPRKAVPRSPWDRRDSPRASRDSGRENRPARGGRRGLLP